ncbi:sugar ABC transporter substrate-binding protein (plasmid) [Embleya sp. NBC_00888]|uniref:sugar ABC transporter substrate-binding protein n=1 Tax=Embleya sp. NBC_00888 TaxID=2975960 RepID=UPI002F91B57F|nr:sugar ABC transporter substrate-binding protein [Embleya sp. NBC_00888]
MRSHSNRTIAGAAALTVVVAVGLSACSSSTTTPSTPSGAAGPKTIKTLQFVNPLPSVSVWKQISDCISAEAKAKGIAFTESGPPASKPGDPAVMIQQVQDAVAAKKDAVITFPASAAFGPVLSRAQKSGVLTATLYGDGKPESGATVNAGVDWGVIGKEYVDAIAALPGQHVVGLVAEGPTGIGKSWTDGVEAAAAKTANVKVKATVYIGADASKALPQVTSLLTANPTIDIVASNTGLMTQGGVAAIKSLGLRDKVRLLVINNDNGGPQAVQDGYAIGVFLQDLCDLSKRTVEGLVQASTGAQVPLVQVHDIIATKDNFQEYIAKGWN